MPCPRAVSTVLAAALTAVLAAPAFAQTPTFPDVVYAGISQRNVLDVYIPASPAGPKPCVVWIHGGGWQSGDKSSVRNASKATELMARGFVVVSINYRLTGEAVFPAQIHDCKGAIRFVRSRAAQYQIDPARIGVWGSSAGGHLVALLGTSGSVAAAEGTVGGNLEHSSRVQAVADYFGPADFFSIQGWHTQCTGTPEQALLGACLGDIQANVNNPSPPWPALVANAVLAGPVSHASADDPPFHIAHGTADNSVWPEHSELLHAALQDAGAESTLRLVPGAGHGLPTSENALVYEFFLEHLGGCRADFNNDGFVTGEDFDGFTDAFVAGTFAADFDGNGFVNGNDFDGFALSFVGGC